MTVAQWTLCKHQMSSNILLALVWMCNNFLELEWQVEADTYLNWLRWLLVSVSLLRTVNISSTLWTMASCDETFPIRETIFHSYSYTHTCTHAHMHARKYTHAHTLTNTKLLQKGFITLPLFCYDITQQYLYDGDRQYGGGGRGEEGGGGAGGK